MDMGTGTAMTKHHTAAKVGALWWWGWLGAAVAVPFAQAQVADGAPVPNPPISVVPRVSVSETWTNNALLTPTKQFDQVTEVDPGVHVELNDSRLKGSVDYAVSSLRYAQSSAPASQTQALASDVTLEAVPNTFFIETSGTISQQAISAFGTQSVGNTAVNPNTTQVSTYTVSPYLQGQLGGSANYLLRYSRSVTSGNGSVMASNQLSVGLKDGTPLDVLGWSLNFNHQDEDYTDGRPTTDDTLLAGLDYAITPQTSASLQAGAESDDYSSPDMQTYPVYGVGLTWHPLTTTGVSASLLHHSYGDTSSLTVDHRTGRTVWHYSNTTTVTQSPTQQGAMAMGTEYDLLYAQFATIQPDPVARAQLVNAYLQANGIAPGAPVTAGYLASTLVMQRQQLLSLALLGVRDTVTFIGSQTGSSNLDALTTAVTDFSSASTITQQSLAMNFAHRLTPDYSLSVLVSQLATTGSLASQASTLHSVNVSVSGKLGTYSSVALGVRQTDYDSGVVPYSESALTCALKLQF